VPDFREEKTNKFSRFLLAAGTTVGCVSSSAACLLGETGWEERTDVRRARAEETALQFKGEFFLLVLVTFNISRFPNSHTCSSCDLHSTRLVGAASMKGILFLLKETFGCYIYDI
jgi:hypothetical protein